MGLDERLTKKKPQNVPVHLLTNDLSREIPFTIHGDCVCIEIKKSRQSVRRQVIELLTLAFFFPFWVCFVAAVDN